MLPVRPVVGLIPNNFRPVPSPDEVAAVFAEPLERFLSTEGHFSQEISLLPRPAGPQAPLGGSAAAGSQGANTVRMHSFLCGEHIVFGLTAHFLIQACIDSASSTLRRSRKNASVLRPASESLCLVLFALRACTLVTSTPPPFPVPICFLEK